MQRCLFGGALQPPLPRFLTQGQLVLSRQACLCYWHIRLSFELYMHRVHARAVAGVSSFGQQLMAHSGTGDCAAGPARRSLAGGCTPIAHGSGGETGEGAHKQWPQALQVESVLGTHDAGSVNVWHVRCRFYNNHNSNAITFYRVRSFRRLAHHHWLLQQRSAATSA